MICLSQWFSMVCLWLYCTCTVSDFDDNSNYYHGNFNTDVYNQYDENYQIQQHHQEIRNLYAQKNISTQQNLYSSAQKDNQGISFSSCDFCFEILLLFLRMFCFDYTISPLKHLIDFFTAEILNRQLQSQHSNTEKPITAWKHWIDSLIVARITERTILDG